MNSVSANGPCSCKSLKTKVGSWTDVIENIKIHLEDRLLPDPHKGHSKGQNREWNSESNVSSRRISRRREYISHITEQCLNLIEDNKDQWDNIIGNENNEEQLVEIIGQAPDKLSTKERKMLLLLLARLIFRLNTLKGSFDASLTKRPIRIDKTDSAADSTKASIKDVNAEAGKQSKPNP